MSNSFEYTVEEIEEIHGLVEELNERALSDIHSVLMDHQEEKNAVRGQREFLRYKDTNLPESKRKDGGLTWYHEPDNSKCFMLGQPNKKTKNNEEVMNYWGSLITEYLEQIGCNAFQFGPDLYNDDGKQIVGLSADNQGNSSIVRACWYEEMPEIDEFLEADGIDKEEWYGSIDTVEGLYDKLKDNIGPEKVEECFISDAAFEQAADYMNEREGEREGTCVNGEISQ